MTSANFIEDERYRATFILYDHEVSGNRYSFVKYAAYPDTFEWEEISIVTYDGQVNPRWDWGANICGFQVDASGEKWGLFSCSTAPRYGYVLSDDFLSTDVNRGPLLVERVEHTWSLETHSSERVVKDVTNLLYEDG